MSTSLLKRFVRLVIWDKDPATGTETIHDVFEVAQDGKVKASQIFNVKWMIKDGKIMHDIRPEIIFMKDGPPGEFLNEELHKTDLLFDIPPRCKKMQLCFKINELHKLEWLDAWLNGLIKFDFDKES